MHVVLTAGARHMPVHLEEERRFADERGGVIGVGSEREETVAIGFGSSGEHHGVGGDMTQDVRHLREMRGYEVYASGGEGRSCCCREEIRGVAQPGELSVEVAVIAQRMHLMDANTGERVAGGVEGAQQQIGLAVRERHDDITVMLGEGHYRRRVGALRGG
jgi:hypothetical protein